MHLKHTRSCVFQQSLYFSLLIHRSFYLLVYIAIEHGKYSTTLYDKRDNFKFDIVNFPDMSSNIPSKPTYEIYISQLVRMCRICSRYDQFCERHYKTTEKLITQGFRYLELCKAFKKFTRSHVITRMRTRGWLARFLPTRNYCTYGACAYLRREKAWATPSGLQPW